MKCKLLPQIGIYCAFLLSCERNLCAGVVVKCTSDYFQVVKQITLEGNHTRLGGHLQGLVTDKKYIYWSFTGKLVKSDIHGKVATAIDVDYHHGDLAYHDGRIYVAFEQQGESKILVYDTSNLSLLEEHDINIFDDYIGTVEYCNNHFYIGEDFCKEAKLLKIHQFDTNFKFIKTYPLKVKLQAGFENIARFHNYWWGSTYDSSIPMMRMNDNFQIVETFSSGFPYGFFQWDENIVLVGHTGEPENKAQWLEYNGSTILEPGVLALLGCSLFLIGLLAYALRKRK